jgi:hypothetical protein
MKRILLLLAAGAMALTPTAILAKPGGGGGNSGHAASTMSQPTAHTSQGSTNGAGWDHLNSGKATGQPGFECEDSRPGHASTAPGSAFNPDGNAGTHYAGEQPQNSRNTASVSQYDSACQPHPR